MMELKQRAYEANIELWKRGLVIYTWGNVSEIDRARGLVAIKPSGVPYERMTAEDIVIVELESGCNLENRLRPSSDTPTHLALYRAFPDIRGITHTHSRCACAWAQAGMPIPCYGTTHADYFYGEIPVTRDLLPEEIKTEYEHNTGLVIVETMKEKSPLAMPAVLVKNHGPFTWGKSGLESVENAVVLEEVAHMALLTYGLRGAFQPATGDLLDKHFFRKHGINAYYGQEK